LFDQASSGGLFGLPGFGELSKANACTDHPVLLVLRQFVRPLVNRMPGNAQRIRQIFDRAKKANSVVFRHKPNVSMFTYIVNMLTVL